MVKILSRAGVSLADLYDVEGSIAGIEQLRSEEVSLLHEMGSTIHSERLSGAVRRVATGDLLQNASFDIVLANLPTGIWRLLGVFVFVDTAARLENVQLSIGNGDREVPFFVWDSNDDTDRTIRLMDSGVVAVRTALIQTVPMFLPTLGLADGQPQQVGEVAFRGDTLGFGAGTVEVTAVFHVVFSQVGGGGLNNIGLPVPSW